MKDRLKAGLRTLASGFRAWRQRVPLLVNFPVGWDSRLFAVRSHGMIEPISVSPRSLSSGNSPDAERGYTPSCGHDVHPIFRLGLMVRDGLALFAHDRVSGIGSWHDLRRGPDRR